MQKNIDLSPLNNMILNTLKMEMLEAHNKYKSELYPQDAFDEILTLCVVIERTLREMNKPTHAKKH